MGDSVQLYLPYTTILIVDKTHVKLYREPMMKFRVEDPKSLLRNVYVMRMILKIMLY